jgi:HJR/Mrr/RecB family endonuclease
MTGNSIGVSTLSNTVWRIDLIISKMTFNTFFAVFTRTTLQSAKVFVTASTGSKKNQQAVRNFDLECLYDIFHFFQFAVYGFSELCEQAIALIADIARRFVIRLGNICAVLEVICAPVGLRVPGFTALCNGIV